MTTEQQETSGSEDAFDAGAFFDDGVEKAGGHDAISQRLDLDPETQDDNDASVEHEQPGVVRQKRADTDEEDSEETPEETPAPDEQADAARAALESTEAGEQDEEVESVIEKLLPKTEPKAAPQIPVSEIVRERQRRQQAERERDELRQRLEAKAEQPPAEVEEKSPLEEFVEENPDDDFVPAKVQLAERKWQEERNRKAAKAYADAQEAARLQAEEAQALANKRQQLLEKGNTSEAAARKAHPDYENVTRYFVEHGQLTDAEQQAIVAHENPAEALYQVCKAKSSAFAQALGIEAIAEPATKAPKAPKEPAGEEMSDEDILREVYGT